MMLPNLRYWFLMYELWAILVCFDLSLVWEVLGQIQVIDKSIRSDPSFIPFRWLFLITFISEYSSSSSFLIALAWFMFLRYDLLLASYYYIYIWSDLYDFKVSLSSLLDSLITFTESRMFISCFWSQLNSLGSFLKMNFLLSPNFLLPLAYLSVRSRTSWPFAVGLR